MIALTLFLLVVAPQGAPLPNATAANPGQRCFGSVPGVPAYQATGNVSFTACAADQAGPWSATWTPDGNDLYVTLFGSGIGAPHCQVAHLDADSLAVLNLIPVGASPQELAFTTRPNGEWAFGFVTNSSGSSVTVFDRSDSVVATIPIPFDPGSPFGTAFPFGLAVSPDQSRVYVGTLDGSGDVHVIDARTHERLASETLHLGRERGFGRPLFAGDTLVLPTTLFHPGFQGSTAEVLFVEPQNPAGRRNVTLTSSTSMHRFPSPQDAALLCDDTIAVAGFDMGAQVWMVDAATATILARRPTGTSESLGKFQALGVSADGLLGVADYFRNEIAWINPSSGEVLAIELGTALPNPVRQPNEISFSPDGTRVAIPSYANGGLAVFSVPR